MDTGQYVVIRSHLSGVWFGVLETIKPYADGPYAFISQARKVRKWEGPADACSLAIKGPSGGQITGEVPAISLVGPFQEMHVCSEVAVAAFLATPWYWNDNENLDR